MKRLTASAGAGLACACALALGCATGRPSGGEPSQVRLWMSPLVRWEAGGPRDVRFAVENASNHTVALAAPDAAYARIDVYAGPEDDRVCGVEPAAARAAAASSRVELAPGDEIDVRVDLGRACRGVPPGEYRFVVSYRSPSLSVGSAGPGPRAWSGAAPAEHGNILVERGTALARTPPVRSRRGGAQPAEPCPTPEDAPSR